MELVSMQCNAISGITSITATGDIMPTTGNISSTSGNIQANNGHVSHKAGTCQTLARTRSNWKSTTPSSTGVCMDNVSTTAGNHS